MANFENTVYYKVVDKKLEFTENESEAVIKMVRNESENKAIMTLINTDDNKLIIWILVIVNLIDQQ